MPKYIKAKLHNIEDNHSYWIEWVGIPGRDHRRFKDKEVKHFFLTTWNTELGLVESEVENDSAVGGRG